jgi:uncharacterized protein (TIGR03083 family)
MTPERFLDCLTLDYARLRDIAPKDLDAAVPSCPGWNVTDLVRHVAEVYLHKVESMRQQRQPDPWPLPEFADAEAVSLLDRGWAELTAEFDQRSPDSSAHTWYEPDQTVGFWIRRMAQETVIHRIDAELALNSDVQPVPQDLAVDGVEEVLTVFLGYGSKRWSEYFGDDLAKADSRPVLVSCGGSAWELRAAPEGVDVEPGAPSDAGGAAAAVQGEPAQMLRWLWGRGGDDMAISGDAELVAQLRRLLVTATQ